MFNRFTERARKVILLAKEESKRFNHDYIGTEHILLGLTREGEGVAATVLRKLGVDLSNVRKKVEKMVKSGSSGMVSGDIPFTPRAKKVIELAMEEARAMGHNYIGTEHLLLGLIREGEGIASRILSDMNLDLKKVRKAIMGLLGSSSGASSSSSSSSYNLGSSAKSKSKTPALDSFGRDITAMAKENKLDPVIGRRKEIERVIQILSRRTKNNPVLLGEAGVGKTAIVEGLAQKIVNNDVPEVLKDRRVITMDLGLMVAGTKYRGQFEERIKAIMEEIKKSENVVIFIDELHTLVGAGGAEGAIDASNILKPALQRGELQCIGATTLDEYRKHIEKDSALERRFQTITINAPSVKETVEILEGLRDRYEAHHRVKMLDESLVAAAKLSDRYITGRYLPDKAIDLIDEAGSKARLSVMTVPKSIKKVEEEIEQVNKEKEAAIKGQDFEKAAQLRDKQNNLKQKLRGEKEEWNKKKHNEQPTVTEEDIAKIVSDWTGIPVVKLEEEESEKLLRMEQELHKRVVGQEEAIETIARAVRRSRSGLKPPKRPIGSFIFLGPTGVGKTLLARALAEFLFGDEEALIQLDMSEYMEKFNISRLVGAPPGYVGYEEGGQLSEQVRRRPYSVILLDEIEKAHPDVFNILLQILEDGRLTDSYGRAVDFRNTILIMTSNVGADIVRKQGSIGFKPSKEELSHEKMEEYLLDEVRNTFKPEFLNRLDDIIVFKSFKREELFKILDIELEEVRKRLKEQDIEIKLTKEAKQLLVNKGFSKVYGARPLKRTIQKYLEDSLSEMLIAGEIPEDASHMKVGKKGDELDIKPAKEKKKASSEEK